MAHLFKASNNIVKRDTSIYYYYCTNYYFEIEEPDIYIAEVTAEEITELRQYGPLKDNKPNPIVEIGLFMDKDEIPISMVIFPGNENEQMTIAKIEPKMIKTLENKRLIYCKDIGLGSTSIRILNDIQNRTFLVTQSIKRLSEQLQNEIFKDYGYILLSSDEKIKLNLLKVFDKYDEKIFPYIRIRPIKKQLLI